MDTPSCPAPTPSPTVSSDDLVAEARDWIGVKWKHMGRTRGGIDCIGLIYVVGLKFGLHSYEDKVLYTRLSSGLEMTRHFRKHGVHVPLGPGGLDALHDADVILLRDRVMPQHVGMIATKGGHRTLIHAAIVNRGVMEETLSDEHRRLAITAFRFPALA